VAFFVWGLWGVTEARGAALARRFLFPEPNLKKEVSVANPAQLLIDIYAS
jgi:hypothetical protein